MEFLILCSQELVWVFLEQTFQLWPRGLVAMFWYGAQTYAASTAVALLIISELQVQVEAVIF